MTRRLYRNLDGTAQGIDGSSIPWTGPPAAHPAEWSDSNLPWAYTSEQDWLSQLEIPADIPIVPLAGTGTNFRTRLDLTASGQPGNFIVQLEEGVYELPGFYRIGSGNEFVAYWDSTTKLCGFLGRGADKTFVQIAPNSMSAECVAYLESLTWSGETGSLIVAQIAAIRIEHRNTNSATSGATPHGVFVGGITFRSPDMQKINLDPSFTTNDYFAPQPAPFMGLRPYSSEKNKTRISHCRFQAFGRIVSSSPPFECAQISTKLDLDFKLMNCEVDGRMSEVFNPNRPKRGTFWQHNNAASYIVEDCWAHDSALSRVACSDELTNAKGTVIHRRCKVERVTIDRNSGDPALNNGGSLGGWSHASCIGYESMAGVLVIEDCILCMDNPFYADAWSKPEHVQFTAPYGAGRTGGTFTMTGTVCRSSGQPQLEPYPLVRVDQDTQWWTEGLANRVFIYHPTTGVRLQPHTFSGTWPPNPATLPSSDTHYVAHLI